MAEINVTIDLTDDIIEKIADKLADYGDMQLVTRCNQCVYFGEAKTVGKCLWHGSVTTAHSYCSYAKMRKNQ